MKKLEKWTGPLGLIFGAIALILSWQANNIAQKQLAPNVMLIDLSASGGGGTVGTDTYCWGRAQLINLGGASTSIIAFSGTVSFLEEEIVLSKYQADWLRSYNESLLNGKLHSFNVTIEPVPAGQTSPVYSPIDTFPEVPMPIKIGENSTVNLLFVVRHKIEDFLLLTYQSSEDPDPRKNPLQIEFELFFSDGTILNVPKTDCQWLLAGPLGNQ